MNANTLPYKQVSRSIATHIPAPARAEVLIICTQGTAAQPLQLRVKKTSPSCSCPAIYFLLALYGGQHPWLHASTMQATVNANTSALQASLPINCSTHSCTSTKGSSHHLYPGNCGAALTAQSQKTSPSCSCPAIYFLLALYGGQHPWLQASTMQATVNARPICLRGNHPLSPSSILEEIEIPFGLQ